MRARGERVVIWNERVLRHQSRRFAFAVSSLSIAARRSSHRGRCFTACDTDVVSRLVPRMLFRGSRHGCCFVARATVYGHGLSSEHDYGHDGDGRSDAKDRNLDLRFFCNQEQRLSETESRELIMESS